jgi:hypothetical protein
MNALEAALINERRTAIEFDRVKLQPLPKWFNIIGHVRNFLQATEARINYKNAKLEVKRLLPKNEKE